MITEDGLNNGGGNGNQESTSSERSAGNLLGLYISEIGKYELLDKAEENYLSRRINQGSKLARKKLILSNLRLVVKLAKQYASQGVSLLDLIQEGNIGLMEAVERFDETKGYKFSTYATWWIKQKIRLALVNQGETVRVPPHTYDIIRKIKNLKQEEKEEGKKKLSREEIAEKLDISVETVKRAERAEKRTVSLDKPLEEGSDEVLGDFIESDEYSSPEKETLKALLDEDLESGLSELSERKREIIKLRYGLDGRETETLAEVGERYGISRERVRQIEVEALEELAKPRFLNHLKRYFAKI
ncbi:MAG: RNA polymerase sigma factor RpoD/SigA [Candidatus Bipolaricaulota bacterium]|nr:sigma-70 family RNA polymerase sigma factor [Candidatus Bipolaricaulota bacterium]MBS3791519.1 sigma-70 family RNA polymerase sigma factor [Candidatus Bipolaricaulota bacterium]